MRLMNNNLNDCYRNSNTSENQKINKNNNDNVYNSYNLNKNKKIIKQNIVNKSNNYSYGKNNLKKVFNSPRSNGSEKNKYFNNYYINKKININNFSPDNNIILDNNYHFTTNNYNPKNIIHRNININNNNNNIYNNKNTNNNIYKLYIKNMKHFKTQTNFYEKKIIRNCEEQLPLNIKDIIMTSPNQYN